MKSMKSRLLMQVKVSDWTPTVAQIPHCHQYASQSKQHSLRAARLFAIWEYCHEFNCFYWGSPIYKKVNLSSENCQAPSKKYSYFERISPDFISGLDIFNWHESEDPSGKIFMLFFPILIWKTVDIHFLLVQMTDRSLTKYVTDIIILQYYIQMIRIHVDYNCLETQA